MILEVKNLTVKNVFSNVFLSVGEGEIINIVSQDVNALDVLAKSFIGLVNASGDIKLFDHPKNKALTKAKEFIGYTSTLKYKVNHKAIDYLKLTQKFYKADYLDRIKSLAESFEINLDKKMVDLTAHEKNVIAIIKAILHNPKLVILNNILDTLDSKALSDLCDVMALMQKNGTSFIVTSQSLKIDFCDKAYILNDSLKEYNDLKNIFKLEFSYTKDFSGSALKNTPFLNLLISNKQISFIVSSNIDEAIKYVSSLKPSYLTIKRPYIGEIFSESLPITE